ncbi:MAG TPA: patatin-like phospholipase family protein [Ktedonobacteraceae bacterium]|jgi:NTE family protein|nr:patatin-like phospholipase family protein [Ktedonobacteraceae bacterium]
MKANKIGTRALVLGGGGVAGVAWELGILTGLHDKGVDVRSADIIIGTSAGSTVGAQITSGIDLESLFASQLTPVKQSKERKVEASPAQMMEVLSQAIAEAGADMKALRARIGAYALAAPTPPEAERRAIIESRLPKKMWPQQHLLMVAVDTATGEEYLMDRESGVSLVDAVAASCAVPGIWPPVTLAGRRYMDGGVRSATNADLARGYNRVLILNPLGASADYMGMGITEEAAALEREGSQVLVIAPDAASTAAIGLNPLDPAARQPSALAGRAQGRELADSVAALWSPA